MSQFQAYPQAFLNEDTGLPEFEPVQVETQKSQTSRVSIKANSKPTTQMELPLPFRKGELIDNSKPAKEVKVKPRLIYYSSELARPGKNRRGKPGHNQHERRHA